MPSKQNDSNSKAIEQLKKVIPAPLLRQGKPIYHAVRKISPGYSSTSNQDPLRHSANLLNKNKPLRAYSSDPTFEKRQIRYDLPIFGSSIHVYIRVAESRLVVGAWGSSAASRRWLNDMLVTDTRLYVDSTGRQAFVSGVADNPEEAASLLTELVTLIKALRSTEEVGDYNEESHLNTYWATGVINFGDWLGPHLLRRFTGKRPMQSNRVGLPDSRLYSVGSVLGWIKRSDVDVWGSGLIRPLSEDEIQHRRKLAKVRIHSVRGRLTQQHLVEKLGWDVPDVFGDPALLLPSVYSPPATPDYGTERKIVFTPHDAHRLFYKDFKHPNVDMIHVRRDFRDVVDPISSARAVISTSLHGLIVAQAYGIPWLWLNVEDQPLWGADFKFEDFFSTLDRSAVQICKVSSSDLPGLDLQQLAEQAQLPELTIDLAALRSALPIKAVDDAGYGELKGTLDSLSVTME